MIKRWHVRVDGMPDRINPGQKSIILQVREHASDAEEVTRLEVLEGEHFISLVSEID